MRMIKDQIKRLLSFLIKTRIDVESNRVAITFDDGPHPVYTPEVLKVLEQFDAKATFFMVGENIKKYPHLVATVVEKGHTIANHTMTHPEFAKIDLASMKKEITDMHELICDYSSGNNYFRPPKGIINLKVLMLCLMHNFKIILWNKDPKDYAANSKSEINEYFTNNSIIPGDILLLHDKTEHTVAALHDLLAELKSRNIKASSLAETLK